jgi:hypothetical protein
MEFSFGIPSQRGKSAVTSVDFYPGAPGVTVLKNAGPRTSKTIVLNSMAVEALGLEEGGQIAFDFTKQDPIIVNATGMSLPKGMGYVVKAKKEYNGLTFKDSKLWAYFVKTYNLDETSNNSFALGDQVSTEPVSFFIELDSSENEDIILAEAYIVDADEPVETWTESEINS